MGRLLAWGLDPVGYHLATLLFHILASLLLWGVLEELMPSGPSPASSLGSFSTAAWLGAMIFALHPVNVMSVAWATALKNTLSGSLALGSCWAFLRAGGTRGRLYGVSLALFLLATLAKTAVGMLPVALLLLLWWKKDRLRGADLLPLVPMAAIGAGMAFVSDHWQYYGAMSAAAVFGVICARIVATGAAGRAVAAGLLVGLAALTWRQTLPYRDLDQAIALDGGYVQAYRERAKSLFRLGKDALAREDLLRLRALGAAADPAGP